MKQTTWKGTLISCLVVIGSCLLFSFHMGAKVGIQSPLPDGLMLAGVLLSCTWALKYMRLIGGNCGIELEGLTERQNQAQRTAGEVQSDVKEQLSNLYRYKMGPRMAQPAIHMGVGLLCILISILLVL